MEYKVGVGKIRRPLDLLLFLVDERGGHLRHSHCQDCRRFLESLNLLQLLDVEMGG